MRRTLVWTALAAALALGVAVEGGEPRAPAEPTRPAVIAETKMPTIDPPPPIPEPEVPPIPPVGDDPFKPGPRPEPKDPGPGLIEEGKRLFNREGRLAVGPGLEPEFVFDSGDAPMRLVPCAWREHIENLSKFGKLDIRWRVSGVATVYRGRNYLLLTKAIRMRPEEENL